MKIINKAYLFLLILAFSFKGYSQRNVQKQLKVTNLFSDHMVLQRQDNVDIWGEAAPKQKIQITVSWGKEIYTSSDANGKWKTKLSTPKAGGPYTINIKNNNQDITIKDVLIGEVWLASGQSNMDIGLGGWLPNDTIYNSASEIKNANFPKIRFLKVPFGISVNPVDAVGGKWIGASPSTAGDFSATAYFYARKLYQELNVPIGIIQSSIGGTPVEAWTSKNSLLQLKDFDKTINGLQELQDKSAEWAKMWDKKEIPKTNEQWKNLNFSDVDAAAIGFDDSQWENLKLPGRIDLLKSGEFDGAVWLRKEINIDNITTNYTLNIGSIDDMEAVFLNGKYIGGLSGGGFASTVRIIQIPKDLLIKGKNLLSIRVIDTGGPGFVNGPLTISNNEGELIYLEGNWKSRLVAEIQDGKFFIYGVTADIRARPNPARLNSNSPTSLFNAMINPLIPFKIKGVIWYQGESNVGRAEQYKSLFPAMITDWRNKWGYEFPFYYVQIAPYLFGDPLQKEQSQKLRDAQSYALKLPRTGMVSTLDVGSLKTVHPAYKQQVGNRLARFALVNEYGRKIVASGPIFKHLTVSGNQLIIEFNGLGSGLKATAEGLINFEIAGADKNYIPANAKISKNTVVVSNALLTNPMYVRYAWSDGGAATLFNKEGLPAATFTSEDK